MQDQQNINRKVSQAELDAFVSKISPITEEPSILYKDYSNYPHIQREVFLAEYLPNEFKRQLSIKGIPVASYLYSITEVNNQIMEFAFKLEDNAKFDAWRTMNPSSGELSKALRAMMAKQLPEGLKVAYIKFKKGSFIIIIGLTIIASVAGKILGWKVLFSALSGLAGLYRILADKEEVKEFLSKVDKWVMDWIKSIWTRIEDWAENTNFNIFEEVNLTSIATAILFPIPVLAYNLFSSIFQRSKG